MLLGQFELGLSSEALGLYALGLNPDLREKPPFRGPAEPRDPSDLRRCLRLWDRAPWTLKPWMTPVLAFWIEVVSDRYPNPVGTDEERAAYYDLIDRVQEAAENDRAVLDV
jgi:hypothetical protein